MHPIIDITFVLVQSDYIKRRTLYMEERSLYLSFRDRVHLFRHKARRRLSSPDYNDVHKKLSPIPLSIRVEIRQSYKCYNQPDFHRNHPGSGQIRRTTDLYVRRWICRCRVLCSCRRRPPCRSYRSSCTPSQTCPCTSSTPTHCKPKMYRGTIHPGSSRCT